MSIDSLSNADLRFITRPKFDAVSLLSRSSCHLTAEACNHVLFLMATFSAADGVMPSMNSLP